MKSVHALAVLGLMWCSATWAHAGPVITNGDFEAVQIGSPYKSTNVADVSGWTHTGSLGDGPLWHVGYSDGSGSITVAGHGNQFVTLGAGYLAAPASSAWSQTVSGFTPGSSYVLTFEMAAEADFSGAQSLSVAFLSGSVTAGQTFTAAAPSSNYWRDWETKTISFVASASSVEISFSADTSDDVGLDNVSLSSAAIGVPEPLSISLLSVGILTMVGYSRFGTMKL